MILPPTPARCASPARCAPLGALPLDPRVRRVVHRPQRDRRRVPDTGDVHLPRAVREPGRGDRDVGLDIRQADRTAEGPAVGGGPDVADRDVVAVDDLGVIEQRFGVEQADLDEPSGEPTGRLGRGLAGQDGIAAEEATRLVQREGEAETGLQRTVGVVDVVAEVAVGLLQACLLYTSRCV